jgi:hypothetical protein
MNLFLNSESGGFKNKNPNRVLSPDGDFAHQTPEFWHPRQRLPTHNDATGAPVERKLHGARH